MSPPWVAGADFVDILPTDENFCVDCAYQIGLKSASRSSFTVSVYRGDEGGELMHRWHKITVQPLRALMFFRGDTRSTCSFFFFSLRVIETPALLLSFTLACTDALSTKTIPM